MPYKIRPELKKTPGYHLDQPKHRIKLNQNESAYDLPAPLKRKISARLGKVAWNRYPSPYAETLTAKIAKRERWTREGILVANGSNVLTQALVTATAVKGRVLVPGPSFSLYALYGELFGNRVTRVPLNPDFSLDRDRFLKAMKRTRPDIVFIANPNAPTGTLFDAADLKAIVKAAPCLVVIDEAYYPFSGQTLKGSLKRFPNLVLLRTFSKAFSLGGVRAGYLLAAPRIVQEVRKLVPPFCVNALSATVAEAVLDSPKFVDQIVKEVRREREKVYKGLKALPGIEPFPTGANFVMFRAKRSKAIFSGLVRKGILIRDVSDGKWLKNCLRVTVGTPKENDAFLRAIKKLV